jgi:predicted nucleic acid-binding protein
VLDTCVLFPAPLYNTLLYAAFHRIYQPIWTDLILAELRRTLLTDGRRAPEAVARRLEAMTSAFEPGANLDRNNIAYRALIDRMPNHPKDRHVLAAAVASEADFLVTENLRDFRLAGTAYQDIAVVNADDFFLHLCATSRWHRLSLLSALHAQIRDSRSLTTIDALLDRLVLHNGTERFATNMLRLREELSALPLPLNKAISSGERLPADLPF